MDPTLQKVASELDQITAYCRQQLAPKTTLKENNGWNHPVLTRDDLADLSADLSQKLKDLNPDGIPDATAKKVTELSRRISLFRADTMQYMFNGHGNIAVPMYYLLLSYCESVLSEIDGWTGLSAVYKKQSQFFKNVNKIKAQYAVLERDCENLAEKAKAINDAKEAADELPATIETLEGAKNEAKQYRDTAFALLNDVKKIALESSELAERLRAQNERATEILDHASTAYSAATAKGLSGAFYARAHQLQVSLRWWVSGLAAALACTVAVGLLRFNELTAVLKDPQAAWYNIIIQLLITFIGIAAPVWFAWLASKQVAHLFKLAEDYSFKASVSKAYEGFRLEAIKYDSKFAEKLLVTAMARLEEEPLRFVDGSNHGSPMAEMAESKVATTLIGAVRNAKKKREDQQSSAQEAAGVSDKE